MTVATFLARYFFTIHTHIRDAWNTNYMNLTKTVMKDNTKNTAKGIALLS